MVKEFILYLRRQNQSVKNYITFFVSSLAALLAIFIWLVTDNQALNFALLSDNDRSLKQGETVSTDSDTPGLGQFFSTLKKEISDVGKTLPTGDELRAELQSASKNDNLSSDLDTGEDRSVKQVASPADRKNGGVYDESVAATTSAVYKLSPSNPDSSMITSDESDDALESASQSYPNQIIENKETVLPKDNSQVDINNSSDTGYIPSRNHTKPRTKPKIKIVVSDSTEDDNDSNQSENNQ